MYEYVVIKTLNELSGTAYMEIGPGCKGHKPWKSGNIFIDDYDFGIAEIDIYEIINNFDHYSLNVVGIDEGLKICDMWRRRIEENKSDFVDETERQYWSKMRSMLIDIEAYCRSCCNNSGGFYIYGV